MVKWFCPRKPISIAAALCAMLLWSAYSDADVLVDGTLIGTPQALMGPDYVLNPTSGRGEGPNLYFSFGQLVVEPGETLTINVPPGVERVFVRVTGFDGFTGGFDIRGEVIMSREPVDVVVVSALPLTVGEGGSFDFDGSLTLTTADSVVLDDGSFPALLTPDVFGRGTPTAYTFNGDNDDVTVSAGALDRSGFDILLAGGTVRLEERATVGVDGSGRLGLAAVGGGGELSWTDSDLVVTSLGGRVEIVEGSTLLIGDGRLSVAGDTIEINDSIVSQTDTSPDGILQLAGNVIGLVGPEISLSGSQTPQLRIVGSSVDISHGDLVGISTGASGGLFIDAGTISLLSTTLGFTSGDADAAELVVRATGFVDLLTTTISNHSTADGDVDSISVSGDSVRLADSHVELSSTGGSAAGILLEAVDRLDLTDGAIVSATTTAESTGDVRALAGNVIGIVNSEMSIDTGVAEDGHGDLVLDAPQVILSAAHLGMIARSGDRGRIEIGSDGLDISNGTVFAMCSDNMDRGGHLDANADVAITFRGVESATAISTCNLTTGDAGVVSLDSPTVLYEHALTLDLAAPSGEDGFVRTGGVDTLLVAVENEDTTGECSVRQASVRSGLDDGAPGGVEADAVLQDDEVDDTDSLCVNREGAEDLLYGVSDVAANEECPDGARLIAYGPDKNGDMLLDDEEIVGELTVCLADTSGSGSDTHSTGDVAPPQGGDSASGDAESSSDTGCGCGHITTSHPQIGLTLLLLVLLGRWRRRRA